MALSLVASLEGKIQNNENSFMAQSAAYDVQKKKKEAVAATWLEK